MVLDAPHQLPYGYCETLEAKTRQALPMIYQTLSSRTYPSTYIADICVGVLQRVTNGPLELVVTPVSQITPI